MGSSKKKTHFRFWSWIIAFIGIIVPLRLRADWRQEWEAEMNHRESNLAKWDKLNWRNKVDLVWRSTSAFWDALWMQSYRWEDAMIQDFRFGLRILRKQPGVTFIAVVTLALGIGANTAIFSVVNMVLLNPLPYVDSNRLVAVWSSPKGARNRWTSAYPDYLDWKNDARSFEHIAVYNADRSILRKSENLIPLVGTVASADLFRVLGVQPELGRGFSESEDDVNASAVTVLSHEVWESQFHSDSNILGSPITLGDRSVTVIGVMPAGFRFPVDRAQVDYYLPLALIANEKISHRSDMFLRCVARLKPGATLGTAQADVTMVAANLAASYPDTNQNRTVWVNELREDLVGDTRPALLVLLGSVGLVLLIACANVANLKLAEAMSRQQETATRLALGASRSRIIRQSFVECAILAFAGGLMGLLCGQRIFSALLRLAPGNIVNLASTKFDVRVLLFTLLVVVVVVVAAGVAPALQSSRVSLSGELIRAGRVLSDRPAINRMRSTLVVLQIAISVTIWVGAGLLVRSFIGLQKTDPGFDPNDVLTVTLAPSKPRFKTADERNLYFARMLDQIAMTPGIDNAAAIAPMPFGGSESDTNFSIVGHPPSPRGQEPIADYRVASESYFEVMKIPMLKGRAFTNSDRSQSRPVVIINERFAERFFPNENPLGQLLKIGADPHDNPNPPAREIVGIVGDAAHSSLEVLPVPEFYVPFMQEKWPSMDFVARAQPGSQQAAALAIRESMRGAEQGEYVAEPRPLSARLRQSFKQREFTLLLLGSFAGLALLLATIGTFGVMSYTVQQRRHEFAIRLALGAQGSDVLKLVMKQGLKLVLTGVVIGLVSARLLSSLMSTLIHGISTTDGQTFLGVALMLSLAVSLASLIPAWRASKSDPLVSLRHQ
jgi:predicted permease